MEEDIKVLEEIKNHQVAFFDPIQNKQILKYYFTEEQRQAIENLIKRNKELEEGLKYRINYCKLLEKELYGEKEIELTKIEKNIYKKEMINNENKMYRI